MSLSKTYNPSEHEDRIYKLWEESNSFVPKNRGNDETFSIVFPPPNANGNLHLGHGLTMAVEDIEVRYHRLLGEASLLLPGADHAGFETWVVYERYLNSIGKSRFNYTRDELYSQIWDFVAKNKDNYQTQMRKLGGSFDWSRYVFTLDNKIVNQAHETFKKMFHDGLIYRAEKLVNYCTYHGTGFADIEVVHKEEKGNLYYINYPLTDGKGSITVATTRPETMLGDVAVAVHPEDEKYSKYHGKTIKLPLTEREIPIICDEMVDINFGTGAVKITPAHDQNDYDVAERHDLPKISVIDFEGKLNHNAADKYRGFDVNQARQQIVHDLKELGLLLSTKEHLHNIGHCYKCGTVIQPLLKEQWFIDMKPLAKPAIEALKANKIEFYPKVKKKQLITYLEGLRDWNISRQITWGIPIPAFQNLDNPDDWIYDDRVDQEEIKIGNKTYRRDPEVFDTWFSSSSWPYATLDFPDGNDFSKFYPLSVMETGADILYPWVSRMIIFGLYNTGQIPFEKVYLHGLVQDEHGQKMSKSKGNVVDPMTKIDQFGSDAFRMGIITGESAGNNRPYDESKIVGARNFCNKLWNIARFIQEISKDEQAIPEPWPATSTDHWILYKLQHTVKDISSDLDNYRFAESYDKLYHFVWDDFADWYIEASKVNPNHSVLQYVLACVLKIAHPFAPFVTEAIWQELDWYDGILAVEKWPEVPPADKKLAKQFSDVIEIVTECRHIIREMKLNKPGLLHQEVSFMEENSDLIRKLAKLSSVEIISPDREGVKLTQTKRTIWIEVDKKSVDSYISNLKNIKKETTEKIKSLEKRLSNKSYVEQAPEKIVNQSRQQLEEYKEKINQLNAEIDKY